MQSLPTARQALGSWPALFHRAHVPLLQGKKKERFNEIQQELSQLSTKFSNNVSRQGARLMRIDTGPRCGSQAGHALGQL